MNGLVCCMLGETRASGVGFSRRCLVRVLQIEYTTGQDSEYVA